MNKATKPVIVVGSLNMDLVVSARQLPLRGETVVGEAFAYFPGGKGANQAVTAARLGANVFMVGAVGRDDFAVSLQQSLQASGVDATFVRSTDTPTGIALITVENSGANTIVVVAGANALCDATDVEAALAVHAGPGILLVQHEVPPATVEYAITAAKAKGWTVILNPAPARQVTAAILGLCDFVIPNETEAATLTGCRAGTAEDAVRAARRLLAKGAGTVVVTLGEMGAVCCRGDDVHHVPPYPVPVVDSTAAGDAYAGALATALAEGCSLAEGLSFAAAAAALAVTRAGAQPSLPWRQEVEAFLRDRGGQGKASGSFRRGE